MSRDPRRIAAVAVIALGLSLSACGQAATGESAGTAPASTSTVQVASTATTSQSAQAVATASATVTQTEAGTSAPAATSASSTGSNSAGSASSTMPDGTTTKDITFSGIGPYVLGATGKQLQDKGLATPSQACEKSWDPASDALQLGFDGDGKVTGVLTKGDGMYTAEGAHVGTSFDELKKLYGDRFQERQMNIGENLKVTVGEVADGSKAIYFGAADEAGEWTNVRTGANVAWISVQDKSDSMPYGC